MKKLSQFSIFYFLIAFVSAWRPCPELSPALKFPCRCNVEPFGSNGKLGAVAMDCDRVVFSGDALQFPPNAPIISFSQQNSGQQTLPSHAFTTSNLPIRKLDFSNNAIRKLPDKAFTGVQETLTELRLADNLLGDTLNPIFSSVEFGNLGSLKTLDLSGNKIKAVEEGILKGCGKLQELYMDRNSLSLVPSNSLNGPVSLKILSLKDNNIGAVKTESFSSQPNLEKIDLRYNRISSIETGAFFGLNQVKEINLAGNKLSQMNSDTFLGAATLQKLDLSENYITNFPLIALKEIENVKVLNLSSNMITKVDSTHLQGLKGLHILDISRNGITSIPPGTFREQRSLKFLDLSLNALRTIEDDALEGLDSLQTLIIRDNNVLLIPGSALGRLPRLSNLYLDFNRVAALSADILSSIQPEDIRYMSLSRNVIRELPANTFNSFKKLIFLDLSGNSLAVINAEMFIGLDSSLMELKLSQNKISTIGSAPLALTKLRRLDLSGNNIIDIPREAFQDIDNLLYLNLSANPHLAPIPGNLLHSLQKLQVVDLSDCGLKSVQLETFAASPDLRIINLRNNGIQEILEGTFMNIKNLTKVDLSHNSIMSIRAGAFVNTMNIKYLSLKGNQLSAFKGEMFNTGTGLEELDISDNQLTYLFPSSFKIHPRLNKLIASNNKFNFFPSELITTLQYLELIDLSNNALKTVEELDFARLPRLRELILSNNVIESISEMAFHNSTQLQLIDLSGNRIERLGERTFEGLARIQKLNLDRNLLSELPEAIFERSRVQMLEDIILSNNKFENAPLKSLQKQYFFISFVDLSHNVLKDIPSGDSILVNIKKLDLSYNPLTFESINNILNDPKMVRELNLAGTNLEHITTLETPFLQALNLSNNNISHINEKSFGRATLLEKLDLSNNLISDFSSLAKVWPLVSSLEELNLSNNSFEVIAQGDLDNLEMLKSLCIQNLEKINKIEKNALKNLPNLAVLKAFNYPRLGYMDVQGILQELPGLESLDIELKDSAVGADQLQPANHPRLRELGIRGYRLRSISSSSLAGLKSKDLFIKLRNTSLSSLPPAILFPIPRSSKVRLDISGSMITVLTPQVLSAIEDRRNSLTIEGLGTNPIHCDCNARALRRWLPVSKMTQLKCVTPDILHGKLLTEIGDDELTCDTRRHTTVQTTLPPAIKTSSRIITRTTTEEPEIIWRMETTPPMKRTKPPQMSKAPMGNDDTLIIGIVGGVVAFIAILIIIICIVRLKMNSGPYRGPPIQMMPPMPMGPGSIPIGYKNGPPPALYAVPPYATNYATLPHKLSTGSQPQPPPSQSGRTAYSTMGRGMPYVQNQSQNGQNGNPNGHSGHPYIIYSDDKAYR